MFDYYPTGENRTIIEPFSNKLVKQLKTNGEKRGILKFFCDSVASCLQAAKIDLRNCAFLIVPSHDEGKWNSQLVKTVEETIIEKYGLSNTLRGIKRVRRIEKQSLNIGQRSIQRQMGSIEVDKTHFETIRNKRLVVLLDDITTTGTSFDACSQKLKEEGYMGEIISFAVGGTQNENYRVSLQSANCLSKERLCPPAIR